MKVIDTLWFAGIRGTTGIVIIEEDITGDRKAYIGVVAGQSEEADAETITSWGSPFPLGTAERIAFFLTGKDKKKNGITRET